MKQRLITAFIGIIIFAAIVSSPPLVLDIAVAVISAMAIYEMLGALSLGEKKLLKIICILFSLSMPFISGFGITGVGAAVYVYLSILMVMLLMCHKSHKFSDIASAFTATIFIGISFSCISVVRHGDHGIANMMLIFLGSWGTDTFAYFAGRSFGKHKLAPEVSPKKTIEGSVGGILGTTALVVLYSMTLPVFFNVNTNIIAALIIGIICGIISQIGDLCASVIKREHGIKDYGRIIPGHGGIMDRFDSVLFTAPVVYLFIMLMPVFM